MSAIGGRITVATPLVVMLALMSDVVDRIRAACAEVARRARHVTIDAEAVPAYAVGLPLDDQPDDLGPAPPRGPPREDIAAFWLTLDAINFGSGWFPTLRKRPGVSGYDTVAGGIRDRFASHGPWSAEELAGIETAQVAAPLGQDPDHELMTLFATSLNDLGHHVLQDYDGQFADVVDAAAGSAVALTEQLADWGCFADTSSYDELEVPFLKRAQIAAADLHRAAVTRFDDLHRLTMFADNLVPHVLRWDGILRFDAALAARIESEALIEHGSAEEVEIRACAVHAVELIVAARPEANATKVDQLLWNRGRQPGYKMLPRHRSRCTAY